jgi:SAM-dependent methyltransferase
MKKISLESSELARILSAPGGTDPVMIILDDELTSRSGEKFPVMEDIYCLLPREERGKDLGDKKFYEENPFGVRDWSDPADVEQGVEKEFKAFIRDIDPAILIGDIGAGSGRISNYLSFKGYKKVISLDYSFNSLRMINRVSSNLCIWGNNLALPFQTGSLDVVISTGVIHHTPDPPKALGECARVLKPGGRMYLRMRNLNSLYGYLFYTYGSFLRFCDRRRSLRPLSDLFGFRVYKLTRSLFYPHLPKRPDNELRGKYENLFIKGLITFYRTSEVKKMLDEFGLKILHGKKVSFTHRQHFYILTKD